MAGFISTFRKLAHGALNWDTQLDADLGALEDFTAQQNWAPTLGGQQSSIGTNGYGDGYVTRLGKKVMFDGRLVFGPSASFGNGGAVVQGLNVFGNIDTAHTNGFGYYLRPTGERVLVLLTYQSGNEMYINVVPGGAAPVGPAFQLGTPDNGAQLLFSITGLIA